MKIEIQTNTTLDDVLYVSIKHDNRVFIEIFNPTTELFNKMIVCDIADFEIMAKAIIEKSKLQNQ